MQQKLETRTESKMRVGQKHFRLFSRQPLSMFGTLTVAALLSGAVLCSLIKLFVGRVGGPPLLVTVGMLIVALIIATGIRWTTLVGILTFIGYLIAFYFQPFVPYHLTQPKIDFRLFVVILLLIIFLLVGLGTGIGAFIQNCFQHTRITPRWFNLVLVGVAGFVIGAICIGAISQEATASTPASGVTYTNGVPTVYMNVDSFLLPSVTISKGSKLLLVDDGSYNHVLFNGSWTNGQPQPESQSGAPTISNLSINGNRVEIGPFTTAGTYHIYCAIHAGMMLTIIVQ